MARIGIYGGTFNPPHTGHIQAAKYAFDALRLDKLLVIPADAGQYKQLPVYSATSQQRLEMLRLSFSDMPNAEILDIELQQESSGYTCDTVSKLRELYPDAELILLMGTDMFLSFRDWLGAEQIVKEASLGVFYRGEKNEQQTVAAQKGALESQGVRVYLLENPVIPISSTNLRRLLTFRCADNYLTPAVADYVHQNNLYGTYRDLRNLSMDDLERTVIGLLNPNRVAHVLGCRDTAAQLARIWGADETDAARAGLLHDVTKALDGPLQLSLCQNYGIDLNDFSRQNPKTLHALTGSLVAEHIFGENPAVVSAICSHTTGKADMNTLEKIIYVADYMEPNRDFPGVEELRSLAYTDLDKALQTGLEMTLAMLRLQGKEISAESQEALAWLKNKK